MDATPGTKAIEAALADRPETLDALVLELLRGRDGRALEHFARTATPRATDPPVRAALEAIARAPGPARALALQALRSTGLGGSGTPSSPGVGRRAAAGSHMASSPATSTTRAPVPIATAATNTPVAPPRPAPSPTIPATASSPEAGAAATAWSAPFALALSDPSPGNLAQAALALVDLGGARPEEASAMDVKDLAGRFAMAAIDQSGDAQQGLARLARGLKALS